MHIFSETDQQQSLKTADIDSIWL